MGDLSEVIGSEEQRDKELKSIEILGFGEQGPSSKCSKVCPWRLAALLQGLGHGKETAEELAG